MENLERIAVSGAYPYTASVPLDWHELPSANLMQSPDWISTWLETFEFADAEHTALTRELPSVARFIRAQFSTDQSWFAVVDRAGLGGVRALASLVAYDSDGLTAPAAFASLEKSAESSREVDVLSRQTFSCDIGDRPAVVMHDLIALPDDSGSALSERYFGMMFPAFAPVTVQLEIQAPDLDAFADVVTAGNTVLASLRFAAETPVVVSPAASVVSLSAVPSAPASDPLADAPSREKAATPASGS